MQIGGLVIGTDGFFVAHSEQLAALTVRYGIPAIFQYQAFAVVGGLMSYGGSVTDLIGFQVFTQGVSSKVKSRPISPSNRPQKLS